MLQEFFAKLFRSRELSDDDLLDAYGAVLETAELYEALSRLPAPKARIKAAILGRAKVAIEEEKKALLVAYLALANFQDSTLSGVSMADAKAAAEKSGDDLVQAVLKLGPNIKNMEVLNNLVTFERRILAQEWEQAEVFNILNRKTAHQ